MKITKVKDLKNAIQFSGLNPHTIRATGTGEYMKEQCAHLVDLFDLAKFDMEQELRQENEVFNFEM